VNTFSKKRGRFLQNKYSKTYEYKIVQLLATAYGWVHFGALKKTIHKRYDRQQLEKPKNWVIRFSKDCLYSKMVLLVIDLFFT